MDPLLWLKYKKVKGSATYNIEIICILPTKLVTKNNIFIKKEDINSESICYVTIWIHDLAKVKGSATYNFNIICI